MPTPALVRQGGLRLTNQEIKMADAKAKTKKVPGLRVRALTAGFRRAGRAWGVEFTEVPASDFSKVQIEQLRGDRQIVVEDCEIDASAE